MGWTDYRYGEYTTACIGQCLAAGVFAFDGGEYFHYRTYEGGRRGALATRPNPVKPSETQKNQKNQEKPLKSPWQKNLNSLITNAVCVTVGTPGSGV
jgi:hypothetical protein